MTLDLFYSHFKSRTDAERAKCAMHQENIRGCELRVSWARPVNMPPLVWILALFALFTPFSLTKQPFYVPPPLRELAMPDPPSGLPFNARPLTDELRSFLQKYRDLPKLGAPLMADENSSDTEMLEDYKKVGNAHTTGSDFLAGLSHHKIQINPTRSTKYR